MEAGIFTVLLEKVTAFDEPSMLFFLRSTDSDKWTEGTFKKKKQARSDLTSRTSRSLDRCFYSQSAPSL